MAKDRVCIPEKELRELYLIKLKSTEEIRKIFNCRRLTVRNKLEKYNIPIRSWEEVVVLRNIKIAERSPEKRKARSDKYRKEGNPNWRGGITPEGQQIRSSAEYSVWRDEVLKRDDYTCQFCKKRGGRLHVDHILPFCNYPELRIDIDNGRTLCKTCHKNHTDEQRRLGLFKRILPFCRKK